jgi:hypothetical protein
MSAFRAAASVLVCAACSGTVAATDPSAPTGPAQPAQEVQAILAKTRDRYRNARSYSDEGTFRDVSNPGDGEKESITTGRFRTRWRAPDRLPVCQKHDLLLRRRMDRVPELAVRIEAKRNVAVLAQRQLVASIRSPRPDHIIVTFEDS